MSNNWNPPPIIYTDGSCKNQGLPNARATYGTYWGDGHPNNRSGQVSGLQDNNRAELFAARQAIRDASRQGYPAVTIRSDSLYVCDSIANSANYQSAPATNRALMQSINSMKNNVSVNTQHVKAHSGNHGNTQAHSLARGGNTGGKGKK